MSGLVTYRPKQKNFDMFTARENYRPHEQDSCWHINTNYLNLGGYNLLLTNGAKMETVGCVRDRDRNRERAARKCVNNFHLLISNSKAVHVFN